MFYYKHHIGDYRRDTGHLSLLEHGVYRQLLDLYYVDEKPIPNETDWVMRRLSAKTQVEKDAVLAVLSDFFSQNSEGWSHKRCDSEILAYEEKADKNQKNGKLGGRPKKKAEINPQITQSVIFDNPNQSENNLNHEPLTINHKPLTKERETTRGSRLSTDFEPNFDFAKQNGIANPSEELEKFRDYWNSQAGQKAVKTDWQATWRNWCRNAKKPNAYTPPSPAITTPSREAVDPLMSQAIQESMRTFRPVPEIRARLARERMTA